MGLLAINEAVNVARVHVPVQAPDGIVKVGAVVYPEPCVKFTEVTVPLTPTVAVADAFPLDTVSVQVP